MQQGSLAAAACVVQDGGDDWLLVVYIEVIHFRDMVASARTLHIARKLYSAIRGELVAYCPSSQ
ncbi:hypothetical protein FOA52_014454 [Chlamydomonas sp. UWO 241]|nr:hypothetical protein FOA52_014454 [Chlamydomonas sp. UWO 241]